MTSFHGQFVWCELMTTDTASASAFYGRVIGWTAKDAGMTEQPYLLLSAGEAQVGGLMELPAAARDKGARPGWMGYVGADDVDALAARVTQAGGRLHHGPEDIPGVGRFAVVSDPQGAAFTLFRPNEPAGPEPAQQAGMIPGHVGWHELGTTDHDAAFGFYAGLFGWTKGEAIDMGAMGTYQLFNTRDMAVGGMMNRTDATPPAWLYYFNVAGIDAAIARAGDAGGKLINGPHQVPGGGWIAHCLDRQGVLFAMFSPER